MRRFRTLLITLALTTTALALAPATSAGPVEDALDCGAQCIEDCHLVVRTGQVYGGCTAFHKDVLLITGCYQPGCGDPLVVCPDLNQNLNCDVHENSLVEPDCHQLLGGSFFDFGVCYDLGSAGCKAWYYDEFGTFGGGRCLVVLPY